MYSIPTQKVWDNGEHSWLENLGLAAPSSYLGSSFTGTPVSARPPNNWYTDSAAFLRETDVMLEIVNMGKTLIGPQNSVATSKLTAVTVT